MSDGAITEAAVAAALRDFQDPESGRSVTEMEQVRDIVTTDGRVELTLELTTHSAPLWDETYAAAEDALTKALPSAQSITVHRAVHDRPPEKLGQIGLTAKSVIAVGSGKGGVGKSTIAASIAIGLQRAGCKVGLLDADVFGPSVPLLMGASPKMEEVQGQGGLQAVMAHGLPVMSIGFLVPADKAVVWRGPMLHSALVQMLTHTQWGDLDYLIVDMPPGTGDIPLSLSQVLPGEAASAVVVCTPQEVALIDAVKAISMFQTVKIPLLGMVENMSGFHCPGCDKKYEIFGSGGAKRRAEEANVPFLGEVPLYIPIREHGDQGSTHANFDDPQIALYLERICTEVVRNVAARARRNPPGASLPVLG